MKIINISKTNDTSMTHNIECLCSLLTDSNFDSADRKRILICRISERQL